MKIAVYGAASSLIDSSYKQTGKELGMKMAERGHGLVFGGGANGMMGAVAEGVFEKQYSLWQRVGRHHLQAGADESVPAQHR